MNFSIQPILENEKVILEPLKEKDFSALHAVASDAKIWEQHPNKDRWRLDQFKNFFDGAIQSKGAFKILEKSTSKIMGSTRFYDYNEKENSILIGYTFYGKEFWGKGFNHSVKALMLNYIFQFVSKVDFHVGAENIRSQISIERLGIKKFDERVVTYFGEDAKLNFVYRLTKAEWLELSSESQG